jgi:hypothetical protein
MRIIASPSPGRLEGVKGVVGSLTGTWPRSEALTTGREGSHGPRGEDGEWSRYIQIENKIRAVVRYEMAEGIPLVE